MLLLLIGFGALAVSVDGQYCLPYYSQPCGNAQVNGVVFAGINNTNTGCTGPSNSNLTNYSSTMSATVVSGDVYNIQVSSGIQFGAGMALFMDFNGDYDFTDPGEYYPLGFVPTNTTRTIPIRIPCGLGPRTTRMRVVSSNNGSIPSSGACGAFSSGEAEDYGLVVQTASGPDIRLAEIFGAADDCALSANEPVSFSIFNLGNTTITSVTACFQVDASTPVCEIFAVNLPPCTGDTITFVNTADLSIFGPHNLSGTVTTPNDVRGANDSVHSYPITNIPVISSIPYQENFETWWGGFSLDVAHRSWEYGVPAASFINSAASPSHAWVTNLDGYYLTTEQSYLVSPCIDLSAATADPMLSFAHIFKTEVGDDGGWVDYSTDGGATWAKLGSVGQGSHWYNDTTNQWWSGSSATTGAWRAAKHPLTGLAGQGNIRLRIAFESDGGVNDEGFGIDDFMLLDTVRDVAADSVFSPSTSCVLSSAETVGFRISNEGESPISNLQACFSVDGAAPVCEPVPGTLLPGSSVNYLFNATADLTALGEHEVKVFTSYPADNVRFNDTIRKSVFHFGSHIPPYHEDFENGPGGWRSRGLFNSWAFGKPSKTIISTAASGDSAWVTGGTGPGFYNNMENSWVESPCFDLSSQTTPWMAMKVWWEEEAPYDGAVLESTTDNGLTWQQIGTLADPYNWYNNGYIYGLVFAGLSGHGWTGETINYGPGTYVLAKHELNLLAGQPAVRFRIHQGSDNTIVREGVAFDDFVVTGAPAVALPPDTVLCDTNHFEIFPGPLPANGSYSWSTGDTTPSIVVSAPGFYLLTYSDSFGITGTAAINVDFATPNPLNLSPLEFCSGDSACATLSQQLYPSVSWSSGSTSHTPCFSNGGQFSVHALDMSGCHVRDTIIVTEHLIQPINLEPDTILCSPGQVCIGQGVPGNSYLWSTGDTTGIICVSIDGSYAVTRTDTNSCIARDTFNLINAIPIIANAVFDSSFCPVLFFADSSSGTAQSWLWSFGDGGTSSLQHPYHDYSQAGNGTYNVVLIASDDCSSDTIGFQVAVSCLVGAEGPVASEWLVIPNPNRGAFRLIGTANDSPVRLEVLDGKGQQVFQRWHLPVSNMVDATIDIQDLPSGIYFLRIIDEMGSSQSIKILVQK